MTSRFLATQPPGLAAARVARAAHPVRRTSAGRSVRTDPAAAFEPERLEFFGPSGRRTVATLAAVVATLAAFVLVASSWPR